MIVDDQPDLFDLGDFYFYVPAWQAEDPHNVPVKVNVVQVRPLQVSASRIKSSAPSGVIAPRIFK